MNLIGIRVFFGCLLQKFGSRSLVVCENTIGTGINL